MIHDQQRRSFSTKSTLKAQKLLRNRSGLRRLMIESLEDRRLLNVDWRNPVDSIDVDSDGSVSPLDALVVINYINAGGSGPLPAVHDTAKPYLDVDGDQSVSPLDVLNVINHLNAKGSGVRSLKEVSGQLVNETSVTITLGQTSGTRDYRVRIDNQFDTTDHSAALEDLLAVYLVDPLNPTTTILDRGTNGTALFTLTGSKAEFVPGRVSWDGSILDINLSDLALSDTGLLKFQLLNSDNDGQTKVSIVPLTNQIDIDGTNGPKLSLDGSPVAAGASTTLANLTPMANGQLQVGNVRYDSSTGKYNAELRLRNDGDALGRDIAVVFPGLPAGVSLRSPSGTTTAGEPYINLKTAIQRGGLTHGSWSEPVAVEFNNPGQVLFVLKPKILATINHAPTLAAIAPLTVMPGGVLNVSLFAADQDGDPITYSLVTTGGTISLPTGTVGSSGVLTFRPTPSQLGTFQFDVLASDGALEASRSVTLNVVADPITTTRVSGKVLKVNGQPLANMPVQIGAVQGLTSADGSFTLDLGSGPVVSDTVKVRGELFSGPLVYPFIAEKTAFILQHDVFAHFNNVIDRPIYLPALDVAGGTAIDPMHDVAVRQQVAPGETAEIFVAAGTLTNLQGTPFTGTLSITEVPIAFTPAALPLGLSPDLVVTIQPGEMVFARPAPLSLPNRAGWAPGMLMDLWSINPVTGQFDDVGDAQVSADGKTVDTISGGVRNSSWHFVGPTPIVSPNHSSSYNSKKACNTCPVDASFNSDVELHSGKVIESHNLVSYQSQGDNQGLRLVFDSLRADPRPTVHFGLDRFNPATFVDPVLFDRLLLVAKLSVERGAFTMVVPGRQDKPGDLLGNFIGEDEHYWKIQDKPGPADAALQVDLRAQPSGVYQYTLDSGVSFYKFTNGASGNTPIVQFPGSSARTNGELVVVNSIGSPFGSGWGIAGLQYLVENDNKSVLLVDGDGSELLFAFDLQSGSYISPAGDFSKFEKRVDGTYQRTLTDKTIYRFDSHLNLVSMTDRNNNVTQLTFDAQARPTGMIDPVGLVTTFTYSGNRVSEITDPAGRTTRMNYDSAGNLLRVTDPDASSRNWEYDSSHHMVGETDQLGRHEQSTYGFHGRATGATRKDGSQIHLQAPETQGLYPPDATSDYLHAPPTFSLPDQAESMYVDGNGNVQRAVLDAAGQAIGQFDSVGNKPSVTRDANNLPITSSNARGSVTTNTFDASGNLLTSQDNLSVRLGDDPSMIGLLVGDFQQYGKTDRYSFVAKAGERIWIDNILGTSNSFNVGVTSPSGKQLSNYDNRLQEDGTYQVTVTGNTGTYVAAIRSLNHTPEIALGTSVTRHDAAGEDVLYRFTAERNQRFVFNDATITPEGSWQLQGPANGDVYLFRNGTDPDVNFLIPTSGEYYLIHGSNRTTSSTPQNLQFTASLVDPVPVAKTGFGTVHSGNLLPNEEKQFSFSGSQGSFVYFDSLETFGNGSEPVVSFVLRDPLDRPLQNVSLSNYYSVPFQLPMSGTYQLVLKGDPLGGSGGYNFRVDDLESAAPAQFDTVIQGSLTGKEAAIYRLTGIAGQRFALEQSGEHRVQLISSGFVNQLRPWSKGILTLPDTGDYYLIVEREGEATNFSLSSIDLRHMPFVNFGENITATFIDGDQEKYFRFHATPGETIYLENYLANLGISAVATPDILAEGTVLNSRQADRFVTLSSSYVVNDHNEFVLIASNNANAPSPYLFGLRIHGQTENTKAIVVGQIVTGRIELNEVDNYTFQGVTGTSLFLDWRTIEAAPPLGFQWQLIGPDEKVLRLQNDPSSDYGTFVLTVTGTYRLKLTNRVNDRATVPRNYEFRLFDTSAAPLVSLNYPLARQLSNGSAVNLFQLSANVGQRLRFEQTSTTTKLKVYSPGGRLLLDSGTNAVQLAALSETGLYLIIVSGRDANAATPVSYDWLISTVADTPVVPSGFDVLHEGRAIEGEQITTFQGNAGSRIVFQEDGLGDYSLSRIALVRIIGPSGETVAQFSGYTYDQNGGITPIDFYHAKHFVLPQSGQYTIKLFGRNAPLTTPKSYRILLTEVSSLQRLEPGVSFPLPVNPAGSIFADYFTFAATAGQQYYLDPILAIQNLQNSQFNPGNYDSFIQGMSVESSDGVSTVYNDTAAGPFIAVRTGTYLVRIVTSAPLALIRLINVSQTPKLPRDTEFSGTNSFATEDVVVQFDVAAGEKLLFRADANDAASSIPFWQIFNPSVPDVYVVINWNYPSVTPTPSSFVWQGLAEFPKAGTYTLVRRTRVGYLGIFNAPLQCSMRMTRFIEPVLPMVGGTLSRTTYTYDPVFSQLTSLTDQQDRRTLLDIDPANGNVRNVTKVVGQPGGGDDLLATFTYLASGQIDTLTDPLGRITDYDYDAKRRLISMTLAKGTPIQTIGNYEYDLAGNISAVIVENGHRTVYEYDAMNRRTRVIEPDPDGTGPLTSPTTQFTYDAVGNPLTVTDALGHVTRRTYDALNRLSSITDPGNNLTSYVYDQAGNVIRVTDPLGNVSRMRYDARNRLVASMDAANFETSFHYDVDNNLVSLTDAAGNSTSCAYDSRNRRVAEYDPFGKVTTNIYNGVNQVVAHVDRLGRTTRLDYDDVGRLVREHWFDVHDTEVNTVNYTYDAASRLVRLQDGVSDLQATYDALSRPTREQTGGTNGVPTTILNHTYDAIGNVLSTTDTINGTVGGTNAYVYDSLDRLTKLSQSSAVGSTNPVAEKRVDLAYNKLGQFTSLARFADLAGNQSAARTSFAYDTLNRLADMSHRNPANAVLDSFAFSYDTASRITRITDIDGATDYVYDVRDQLSVANHADIANPDEAYVYDGTGNRTSSQRHGSGYVVGDGVTGTRDNNRLTSDGTYGYAYDAEGNLITRTQIAGGAVREFSWDIRNRLTRVTDRPSVVGAPTQVVDYTYDTLNRRIASKVDTTPSDAVDGKITYFVYDGRDVLVELVDLDGSGPAVATESMRYMHGPAVDQIFAQEDAAGDVLWDLADHLGTVRDLVNNNGVVVNHLKYDSYGNFVAESNPAGHTRYQYTGREQDAETGLQYNRARYYDTVVGRFLSEDPIGFGSGSPNLYSYVGNQPISQLDSSGFEADEADETRRESLNTQRLQQDQLNNVHNSQIAKGGRYLKEHVLDNLEAIGNVGISAIASMRSRLDSAYNTLLSPLAWKRKRDKLNNIRTDLQNRLDEFEREKARFKADYQKDCHFVPGAQRIENFDLLRSRITFLLQEEARLTKR